MKPELTPELKERFFSQYWGQNVLCMNPGLEEDLIVLGHHIDVVRYNTDAYLLLRPLSSITNEEAKDIAVCAMGQSYSKYREYSRVEWFSHPIGEVMSTITVTLRSGHADQIKVLINQESAYIKVFDNDRNYGLFDPAGYVQKLLSIGVAIPFMGHSVKDLVNAGWVKLREV